MRLFLTSSALSYYIHFKNNTSKQLTSKTIEQPGNENDTYFMRLQFTKLQKLSSANPTTQLHAAKAKTNYHFTAVTGKH